MIYLDYNATTPVASEVVDAMLPYFTEFYGNAASRTHLYGWDAKEAVGKSRKIIADFLTVKPKEIIFTSGATEAINLAIKGVFEQAIIHKKNHIITVKTEHKAVLDTCAYLETYRGASITYLDVDTAGNLNVTQLEKTISEQTCLVVIMTVNNETGIIHPIKEIAQICNSKNVLFFSDATQAIGKMELYPKEIGIDIMAFSSHKIYGPKGIGALFLKDGVKIVEQISGGGHERKRRSGTLNVPAIVGFGKAIEIAAKHWKTDNDRLQKLRNLLVSEIQQKLNNIIINGNMQNAMPHVLNIVVKNVEAEALLLALSTHVALSSGSACNSASVLPSHVLKAMELSDNDALSSIRFSLGRETTQKDIEITIKKFVDAVNRLRT